jgi:hypothetical protein
MTNREKILRHLQFIFPEDATISEIEAATGVSPHAQVYQKTQELLKAELITGIQIKRTWHFKAKSGLGQSVSFTPEKPADATKQSKQSYQQFETFARKIFSEKFVISLRPGSTRKVSKQWDMISEDKTIIGDAKYYTLVGGSRMPPAKFATIAEHVWLLEKIDAKIKFLVFGNQIEVPKMWLNKYGNLVSNVRFYFLNQAGKIDQLH